MQNRLTGSVVGVDDGTPDHLHPLRRRALRLEEVGLLLVGHREHTAVYSDRSLLLQQDLSFLLPALSLVVHQFRS